MNFRDRRAYVNHSLLRNGILDRLGLTPDLYHGPQEQFKEALAKQLASLTKLSENHRVARRAWTGGTGYEPGLRVAVSELVRESGRLETVERSGRFPDEHQIQIWLDEIAKLLEHLDEFCTLPVELKNDAADRFADAMANLMGFIRSLDPSSSEFWELFHERALV